VRQIIALILTLFSVNVIAQTAALEIDTNQLRIGEQTTLRLSFLYKDSTKDNLLIWPEISEELVADVEIIKKTVDKEVLIDSNSYTYLRQQIFVISSFEPGNYTIPGQEILLNDSVYTTNEVNLSVATVELDTSKSIYGNKPIYTIEYPLQERAKDFIQAYWYWFAIPLFVGIAVFLYFLFRKKKPETETEEPEVILPAHVIALEVLNELKQQKAWESAEKKVYYSRLTDTVRAYLENRFDIHAMEKTTREIISDLKFANISEEDKIYLRKILREADMVKFAKLTPDNYDAETYLNKSIDFVIRTKTSENE
jgi:hypothetical protein